MCPKTAEKIEVNHVQIKELMDHYTLLVRQLNETVKHLEDEIARLRAIEELDIALIKELQYRFKLLQEKYNELKVREKIERAEL